MYSREFLWYLPQGFSNSSVVGFTCITSREASGILKEMLAFSRFRQAMTMCVPYWSDLQQMSGHIISQDWRSRSQVRWKSRWTYSQAFSHEHFAIEIFIWFKAKMRRPLSMIEKYRSLTLKNESRRWTTMFAEMISPGLENLEVSAYIGCKSGNFPLKGGCYAGIIPVNGICRAGALR